MSPALPYEEELFNHPTEISGTVFANDRFCVQTEEGQRVISAHGVVFSNYSVNKTNTLFAGTQLLLRYSVAPSHPEAKSGHISD